MGGGSKTQTVNNVSKVELPAWVNEASQQNYDLAKQVAATPYSSLARERQIADFNSAQTGAFNMMGQNVGSTLPYHQLGGAVTAGLLDYAPQQVQHQNVNAGQLSEADLSKYINPFTDQVIDRSLADIDRTRMGALNQNSASAAAASSFGGSRHGVIDALTNSEAMKTSGDFSAALRSKAFDTAMGLANTDINRRFDADRFNSSGSLQAGMANQGADLAGAGLRGNMAGQLSGIGGNLQDAQFKDYMGLLDSGDRQQAQQQLGYDTRMMNADARRQYDIENLNIQLAALGMSPYGKTETTNGTTKTNTPTDWATLGLGGAKILASMLPFSDRRLKRDIEVVGQAENGLILYKWNYIWGEPAVGFMADEVQKRYPEAVGDVAGYMTVNYEMLS